VGAIRLTPRSPWARFGAAAILGVIGGFLLLLVAYGVVR
jgi:hypothetical protein